MSKAILVIDMPEQCNECPCFYDYLRCQANVEANVFGDKKPNNCPLKPIPRKRGKITLTERTQDIDNLKWQLECNIYSEGYNKCIDEILGEEE